MNTEVCKMDHWLLLTALSLMLALASPGRVLAQNPPTPPENIDWVNYRLGQYTDDPEAHPGVYLLGNLKTGLWFKVHPNAKPDELPSRIKQVLYDTEIDAS